MTAEQQAKLRGLWEVMASRADTPPTTAEAPPEVPADEAPADEAPADEAPADEAPAVPPAEAPEKPKSLWAVMSGRGAATAAPAPPAPAPAPAPPPVLPREAEPEPEPVVSAPSVPFVRDEEDSPAERWRRSVREVATPGVSRMAAAGGLVGMISLPAAFLAVLPGVWALVPAMVVGCTGLILGLLGLSEIGRSRGRKTGRFLAVLGLVAGCVGMFLGPLVIDPHSDRERDSARDQMTHDHLRLIGQALDQYHVREGRYPAGGTFKEPDPAIGGAGPGRPLHGWNTALLPFLGHDSLYQSIDFAQPWNAEANRPFMQQGIGEFQAGGHAMLFSAGGYGLSHFSGVGGHVDAAGGASGAVEPVGVFERNSAVTRLDVTDGLADTLIVGEVATNYSPWGQPGNWRVIGAGLNRESSGFGNPAHTGAHFLSADGSVRFLGNNVSPEVLRSLSTRSAGD